MICYIIVKNPRSAICRGEDRAAGIGKLILRSGRVNRPLPARGGKPSRAVRRYICMFSSFGSTNIGEHVQEKGLTSNVVDVSVRSVLYFSKLTCNVPSAQGFPGLPAAPGCPLSGATVCLGALAPPSALCRGAPTDHPTECSGEIAFSNISQETQTQRSEQQKQHVYFMF